MIQVKYLENIELRKYLKKGDITLIARASKKSTNLILKVFYGTRRMKPEVKRVYDLVVRCNSELEKATGVRLTPESFLDKKPNV